MRFTHPVLRPRRARRMDERPHRAQAARKRLRNISWIPYRESLSRDRRTLTMAPIRFTVHCTCCRDQRVVLLSKSSPTVQTRAGLWKTTSGTKGFRRRKRIFSGVAAKCGHPLLMQTYRQTQLGTHRTTRSSCARFSRSFISTFVQLVVDVHISGICWRPRGLRQDGNMHKEKKREPHCR